MEAFITLDTLYLHMKYPKRDVFDFWNDFVKHLDKRVLRTGYVVHDFVVKTGACGYALSIWNLDARIFLTDQVDQKCGDGNGMGIWIQLGPKFLIEHGKNLQGAVKDLLDKAGTHGDYPISITRLDMAVDLLGVSMLDQDVNKWSEDWVGRSKLSALFRNSRTGNLETMYIGSRSSPVFIRVYDKVAQSLGDGDYQYWLDIWKGFTGDVTRIEWEVKPKDGNFYDDLKDFSLFNGFSIRELMNYLLDWGRLCDENPDDSNRRRWPDSRFWADLRAFVVKWGDGVDWPTSRLGKSFHGVSPAYLKFVSGTLSGAMARLSENEPSMYALFDELNKRGETLESINRKAKTKAAIIKRL
ncbi:MAG: hypothetical protein CVU43_08870 [Chloroflexi bacterium HGW-Chloroflexi-5]|jgi:hypothetical protein|nr:MAG: hypothetical protein CVU43_08870 [Chloroflexi bacterium HGW-Chloroflexi-5]